MKLRWRKTYDITRDINWLGFPKYNVNSVNKVLQYYDEELKDWIVIPTHSEVDEWSDTRRYYI